MNTIFSDKKKEYLISVAFNVIGSIGLSIVSYALIVIGLGVIFKEQIIMLGFPLPVIIFLCLFISGIIKYVIDSRSDSDEGLETDNIQSVGTILGNLMTFVNNIVLGSSYCLVRAMTSLKKLKKIGTINNKISSEFLSQIQSKTKDKRYHNMSDFKEFAPHIEDLIYHDIIWERAQGGVMQIALNRKYDNVKVA